MTDWLTASRSTELSYGGNATTILTKLGIFKSSYFKERQTMDKQKEHEFWNWEHCKTRIKSLKGRLGFEESPTLKFLQLSLSLENGVIYDNLRNRLLPEAAPSIYCILSTYADAKPIPEALKLVSFKQLPGGNAYNQAFLRRTVLSIKQVFGPKPKLLAEAAKLLGGTKKSYGDYSVEIRSLPLVPITVILWTQSAEFQASVSMLFDATISHYLTMEQVAILGGLTSAMLRHAFEALEKQGNRLRRAENP